MCISKYGAVKIVRCRVSTCSYRAANSSVVGYGVYPARLNPRYMRRSDRTLHIQWIE